MPKNILSGKFISILAYKYMASTKPFDYALWCVLENKTNATSLPNIEKEWNETSEEFILKACKLFESCVDTIIEKNGRLIE